MEPFLMCSQAEADMRQSLNTLSLFEMAENCPGRYDPCKVVKEYCRGEDTWPYIRTPEVLSRTLDYLFEHTLEGSGFLQRYAFLSDRFRAVEKDYRVTNTAAEGVRDLERIARFHILSAGEGLGYKEFERELNWKRLEDLLELLEEVYVQQICPSQGEFAAYRLLFCLDNPASVYILMKKSDIGVRADPLFRLAIRAVGYYYTNNYVGLARLAASAPHLTQVLLFHQLCKIDILSLMRSSYRGSLPPLTQYEEIPRIPPATRDGKG